MNWWGASSPTSSKKRLKIIKVFIRKMNFSTCAPPRRLGPNPGPYRAWAQTLGSGPVGAQAWALSPLGVQDRVFC